MRWRPLYPWLVAFAPLPGELTAPEHIQPADSPYLILTIAGYLRRFLDDAAGFALTWNYWFNDAVSTASDLVALQLVLQYWTDNFPGWALSLIFWVVLIGVNIITVAAYGELEYWLSLLKVVTIIVSSSFGRAFRSAVLIINPRSSSSLALWSTAVATQRIITSEARIGESPVLRSLAVLVDLHPCSLPPRSHVSGSDITLNISPCPKVS